MIKAEATTFIKMPRAFNIKDKEAITRDKDESESRQALYNLPANPIEGNTDYSGMTDIS